jgi:carbon storage regulator
MLVLSRKQFQQIVINNNIVITVVKLRGDKVRLGISASEDIPIHRKEASEQ